MITGKKSKRKEFRESEGKHRKLEKLNLTGRDVSMLQEGRRRSTAQGTRGRRGPRGADSGQRADGGCKVSHERENTWSKLAGAGKESLCLGLNCVPQ